MSTEDSFFQQIASVRYDTIALLGDVAEKAKGLLLPEAPKIPAALEDYRRKLISNSYQVLVVGEANRGKSSFVNALIGRELLPTDVDVATSQVFRVRHAEHEAYRVRFADGSTLEISASDLERYGKQKDGEKVDHPFEKTIRWIEVDFPVHFLPPGVSILDTPGVGALYAAHEQITQRFVPYADAVIFVLDSLQPILQEELNFINAILDATPNILFIQTKIDIQRQEDWQSIRKRNEQILQERIGDRLKSTRIWPISSTYLLEAIQPGKEDDKDYLRMSGFESFAAAWQNFLFRSAGWDLAAQAVQLVEAYHALARQVLVARIARLTEDSEQSNLELQKKQKKYKHQFLSEWGEYGIQRQQLLTSIQKVVTGNQQEFLRIVQPGSQMETEAHARIDALSSLGELQAHAEVMPGQVFGSLLNAWRETRQQTYEQVQDLLTPLLRTAYSFTLLEEPDFLSGLPPIKQELTLKGDRETITQQAQGESIAIGNAIRFISVLSGNVWIIANGEAIAAIASLLWMGVRRWQILRGVEIAEAKRSLHEQLDELLISARTKFLGKESEKNGFNRVSVFFTSLLEDTAEQVLKIVEQKSAEIQAEIDWLTEERASDEQLRQTKIQQVHAQLATWDTILVSIKSITTALKSLEKSFGIF